MNLNTLMQVRQQTWQSFPRAADALFELADALTCESVASPRDAQRDIGRAGKGKPLAKS